MPNRDTSSDIVAWWGRDVDGDSVLLARRADADDVKNRFVPFEQFEELQRHVNAALGYEGGGRLKAVAEERVDMAKRNVFDLLGDLAERNDMTELFGGFFGIDSLKPNSSVRVIKGTGQVKIEIDVPGSSKSDVSVDITEMNILRVEWKTPAGGTHLKEFRISRSTDVDHISASVANGMVTIIVPELPKQSCAKKIEVT